MGLMDKIKGFFYDEEEIEEEVKIPVKRELPKKKPIVFEDEEKKEVPERELFRAERTFNFPIDMDDEPDFTPVKKSIKEEKNVNNKIENLKSSYSSNSNSSTSYRAFSAIKPQKAEPAEEKRFKPTPIISPIYGIMEGELTPKEEKKELLFNNKKDLSVTKRINFDEVRQKAYGSTKSDYIEKTEEVEENENKGIFFNLDDDKDENKIENDDTMIPKSVDEDEEDDIKITYNDVDYDDESTDDEEDEIEIPKITRSRTKRKVVEEETDEDAILSETKEQDLFNLIDNMYNSEDEEDDE